MLKTKEKKSDDGDKKQKTASQTMQKASETAAVAETEKVQQQQTSQLKSTDQTISKKSNETDKTDSKKDAEIPLAQNSSESKTIIDSVPIEETANKTIVTIADVNTPTTAQETQLTAPKTATITDAPVGEAATKLETGSLEQSQLPSDGLTKNDATNTATENEKTGRSDELKTEATDAKLDAPMEKQESGDKTGQLDKVEKPAADSATINGSQAKEKEMDKEGKNESETKSDEVNKNDQTQSSAIPAEPKSETKSDDKVDVTQNAATSSPKQDESMQPTVDDSKTKTVGDEQTTNITNDPSKSFQVLPNDNKSSDKTIQEPDDTGNLAPPKEQTIRKTSFTVLKSDESIDDLLAGVDENSNKTLEAASSEKHLTRPKSFKVLNAHDVNGEDILLQQSSDQETGGNENDDDYLNRNIENERSGKYSDSELIKFDGQMNGRRKKYKKRAKSVKQLTIVDGSQQSKDQDSGFEPSPRTIRSQKAAATRAIYTASLPERPRVGDTVDGRSTSSRFEQRKPGDKNAVNMTTVSQTLQRNIRRYYYLFHCGGNYQNYNRTEFKHFSIQVENPLHSIFIFCVFIHLQILHGT